MSYILDALRRADAERDRGEVPGLHTQQFGVLPGDDEAPRRPRLLIGIVVVLAVALAGLLAWNFFGASEPVPKPVAAPPLAQSPPPPLALAPVLPVLPVPASQARAMPMPMPQASVRPASAARETMAARPPARAPVRRELPASASTPLPSPDDRIYTLTELPEAIRRDLPKIAFGGASYSGDKASRMVILNGQVFHEGDTVAPGLVLKQVRQKSAVLTWKGYRYELGF